MKSEYVGPMPAGFENIGESCLLADPPPTNADRKKLEQDAIRREWNRRLAFALGRFFYSRCRERVRRNLSNRSLPIGA
jgi:hypothetical protein